MKLEVDENLQLEQSENFKSNTFKIEASATAFQILSAGIYSDPILAVIRELSTNAYDAHVAAEKNGKANQSKLPFDVTLPTTLNPVFKVRDYGTGLSEEDVMNLYTTYFGSSKRSSNLFQGSKGLGSKSPFAIVSSYLVISFFNGKQTVYSCHKGQNGPEVIKMKETNTSEPNGLEIDITVSPDDIYNFTTRAQKIYQFFDPRPNIKNGNLKFEDIKYQHQGKTWSIRTQKYYNLPIGVIEGSVCYPISNEALMGRIDQNLLDFYDTYEDILEFNFQIGSTTSTASREDLEYTPQTIKSIEVALRDVISTLSVTYKDQILSKPTYVDTLNYINTLLDNNRTKPIVEMLFAKNSLKYKGITINKPIRNLEVEENKIEKSKEGIESLTKIKFRYYTKKKSPYNVYNYNGDLYDILSKNITPVNIIKINPEFPLENKKQLGEHDDWYRSFEREYKITYKIPVRTGYEFFLNDAKLAQYKIRQGLRDLLNPPYGGKIVFSKDNEALMEKFKKALGITEHFLTSNLGYTAKEKPKEFEVVNYFRPQHEQYEDNGYYKQKRSYYGGDEFSIKQSYDKLNTDEFDVEKSFKYYLLAVNGIFNFGNIFQEFDNKKYGATDAKKFDRMCAGLVMLNIISKDDMFVIIPKSKEAAFNQAFPKVKPFYKLFESLKWDKLSDQTRLDINGIVSYNASRTVETNQKLLNFFNVVMKYGKDHNQNFYDWAHQNKEKYSNAINTVAKSIALGKDYRFNDIKPFLKGLIKEKVYNSNFFEQIKQIEKSSFEDFPILKLDSDFNKDSHIIFKYALRDWEERGNNELNVG